MVIFIRPPAPECNSLDHLVGAGEQRGWHREAEHPGGLGVDDQFEPRRLHDRQVRGLRALEDAAGIDSDLTKRIRNVGRSSSARRLRQNHARDMSRGARSATPS